MKKQGLLLLVLVVVLAALALGCKNETASLPKSVTFEYAGSARYRFRSDGAVTQFSYDDSTWTERFTGTYTCSQAVLILTIAGYEGHIYTDSTKTAGFASYKDLENASSIYIDEADMTFNKVTE